MLAKRLISANFSRSAAEYDQHAVMQRDLADDLLSLLTTYNLELKTILDIGCGTGYLTKKLAERFPAARVEGIDIAPGMIEEARKQKRNNLFFRVGDGEEVRGMGEYDLVVANASLQWMSLEKTVARVTELLKPGGLFLFTTFGPKTLMELKECGFRVNEFPDTIMIEQLLKPHFRNVFLASLMSREKFPGVKELIYYLKELGAAAADGEGQFQLSSFRKYKESYGDEGGISASFELIYGVFEKKQS